MCIRDSICAGEISIPHAASDITVDEIGLLMAGISAPPRSTRKESSAASDVYKRQLPIRSVGYDADGQWRRDILTVRYVRSIEWDSCHANRPNLTVKHVDARKLGSSEQHRYTSQDQIEKLVQANNTALAYADAEGQDLPPSSLIPTLDPPKGWLQPTEQSLAPAIKNTFPTTGSKHAKQRAWDYAYPSGTIKEIIKDLGLTEHFDNVNWA